MISVWSDALYAVVWNKPVRVVDSSRFRPQYVKLNSDVGKIQMQIKYSLFLIYNERYNVEVIIIPSWRLLHK